MRWSPALTITPFVCAALGSLSCGGTELNADGGPRQDQGSGNQNCSYPGGSNGSFAVGEILTPYSWPSSLDVTQVDRPLDLEQAHCNTDPNMEWSPFDMLLFVSIPAW